MLDGRVYRTAFLPALVALFLAAFALQDRPAPGRSVLPPDAFSVERAFGTQRDRNPARSKGSPRVPGPHARLGGRPRARRLLAQDLAEP